MASPASDAPSGSSVASGTESLSACFHRAQRLFNVEGRSAADAAALAALLANLTQQIEAAALFSRNEEVEDLTSRTLKYALVPYYAGAVEAGFPCALAERQAHLEASAKHHAAFVQRLEDYGLADAKEVEAFRESNKKLLAKLKTTTTTGIDGESAESASAVAVRARPVDPNAARTAKIARFRREKELTSQLEVMTATRKAKLRTSRGTTVGATNNNENEDDDEEALDSVCDEDEVRAFYTLLFQSLLHSCVDSARSGVDEAEMLAHHRNVEMRRPEAEQLANLSQAERAKQLNPSSSRGGKPTMMKMTPESLYQPIPAHMAHLLQNVAMPAPSSASSSSSAKPPASSVVPSTVGNRIDSLISSRANARDEVFKLTNQPLYSIEQWAEGEIAAGRMPGPDNTPKPRDPDPRRIRSAADRDIAQEMVDEFQRTQLEGDEGLGYEDGVAGRAADEIQTLKAREWDNWKDDHQKGVGNTMK